MESLCHHHHIISKYKKLKMLRFFTQNEHTTDQKLDVYRHKENLNGVVFSYLINDFHLNGVVLSYFAIDD